MSLFRGGNDDAFRVIHDRYRQRLHAYSRQMLAGSVADAEDVVQEIFVRAYGGLRSSDRELALRAWLYRIAHNRCIDEIRRPQPIATEAIEELTATAAPDPMARIEQRDALRRLIADVRRLPEQQRSALLMRELGGMPYADVAQALAVSVPAVKSLLVRARVGLAQAGEARDTSCTRIREDLMVSHDRGSGPAAWPAATCATAPSAAASAPRSVGSAASSPPCCRPSVRSASSPSCSEWAARVVAARPPAPARWRAPARPPGAPARELSSP